eukprot:scaffold10947_cov99-Phaeocystis_antarctica.AAC.3
MPPRESSEPQASESPRRLAQRKKWGYSDLCAIIALYHSAFLSFALGGFFLRDFWWATVVAGMAAAGGDDRVGSHRRVSREGQKRPFWFLRELPTWRPRAAFWAGGSSARSGGGG